MMGGDLDSSSKGIAGIHIVDNDAYLLIVVSSCTKTKQILTKLKRKKQTKNYAQCNVMCEWDRVSELSFN